MNQKVYNCRENWNNSENPFSNPTKIYFYSFYPIQYIEIKYLCAINLLKYDMINLLEHNTNSYRNCNNYGITEGKVSTDNGSFE